MRRPLARSDAARVLLGASMLLMLGVGGGCARGLPEPESEGAKLYVQYCSGSGCHDPIPPQTDSIGYWNNQYDRMIELMREQGWKLPSADETRVIRSYLEKHAYRP